MKKQVYRLLCLILVVALLGACSSGASKPKYPPLNVSLDGPAANTFSFQPQPSDMVTISETGAKDVLAAIAQVHPEYPYASLYQLEEVKSRLDFDPSVDSHQFTARNAEGVLDGAHLASLVKKNNAAFLATDPFGYKDVEEDYVSSLCSFIVRVVDAMEKKYPDIDWPRVYCNLGRLKILYNVGMLSFAQVSEDAILSISENNTEILLTLKGEDGFGRVLTHEIMHIIQIGCSCENIENCGRRAGIAVYWDDFTLNTTDWTWMVEGAAERNMCNLTGGDAITYQYKVDYLCSMTMSVLLRDSVRADTMETLCFYSDPELLFDTFDCQTQGQRDELLNMMITLQVLQIGPKSFHIAYKEATGIDLMADEEAMNQFNYSLKPAICITLAKEFYENLIPFLQNNQLTFHDLFFLINLFEGHLNQHLTYKAESKAQINQPFFSSYCTLRDALFTALETDNPGKDVAALYAAYNITAAGKELLNAELAMLPAEKRSFLAERAQWQSELGGLGQKVPQ